MIVMYAKILTCLVSILLGIAITLMKLRWMADKKIILLNTENIGSIMVSKGIDLHECPNCKKMLRVDVETWKQKKTGKLSDTIDHTCKHCGAYMYLKRSQEGKDETA